MISGKSFASMCQWVYDPRYPERRRFSYSSASDGDWVFVNGDYLQEFKSLCPFVSGKRFFIIVHNTDRSFGIAELGALLRISKHICAINTTITHPNVTTIPLGFVDNQLQFLETFRRQSCERDIDIYANFTRTTNSVKRNECIFSFKDDTRVTWRSELSVSDYYSDLCRSKFVLCPEGTGIDTHRVYESLLCGATPVVLRNSLSPLYEKLPVCIVDSWTDPFYVETSKSVTFNVLDYIHFTTTLSRK